MGIDPGIRIMGYGLICCEAPPGAGLRGWKIGEAGAIRSDAKAKATCRVGAIHQEVFLLLEKTRPDFLVMEGAFFGVNPQSSLRLGEARGAVISAAYRLNLQVRELSPATVKKVITGNGRGSKESVARSVSALLKISLEGVPFDVSDALAIALAGAVGLTDHRPADLARFPLRSGERRTHME